MGERVSEWFGGTDKASGCLYVDLGGMRPKSRKMSNAMPGTDGPTPWKPGVILLLSGLIYHSQ